MIRTTSQLHRGPTGRKGAVNAEKKRLQADRLGQRLPDFESKELRVTPD